MIPRYSRPEMTAIWAPETKFRIWFEIEIHAAAAMAEIGAIPRDAKSFLALLDKPFVMDVARIDAIEREVKHDIIAFLTYVSEVFGDSAQFLHQGMTSSDVLDTCLAVQLKRASGILIADVDALLAALKKRAFEFMKTPCIGRSHGIHAEPTTFGLKLAGFYAEFQRARERLVRAREEISTCAISGSVGTFANIDPRVESAVAAKLGLKPEPVSSQIVPRDRHAAFFAALGIVASSLERLAIEIRHLQRTEVMEAEEFFSEGQKGSSSMPHKRNPVLSENVTGLARMVRAYVVPALEDVALWHERDISHSSVERVILPDSSMLTYYLLVKFAEIVEGLEVFPDRMVENLERSYGLVFSQPVLLALVASGLTRDAAYRIVQRDAMVAWNEGRPFRGVLEADPEAPIDAGRLDEAFDLARSLRNIAPIFDALEDVL